MPEGARQRKQIQRVLLNLLINGRINAGGWDNSDRLNPSGDGNTPN